MAGKKENAYGSAMTTMQRNRSQPMDNDERSTMQRKKPKITKMPQKDTYMTAMQRREAEAGL